MDADERNLWVDFGHYTALAVASFGQYGQVDFRIKGEQTDERAQLATDLCTAVLQRLSARGIKAEAEAWYDDAAGYFTFAIKQVRSASDTGAQNETAIPCKRSSEPKKPWWKPW